MGTVVLASCTPEQEAMLAERRRLGQDRLDEIWQGVYHTNPGPHSRHGALAAQVLLAIQGPAAGQGLRPTLEVHVEEIAEAIAW